MNIYLRNLWRCEIQDAVKERSNPAQTKMESTKMADVYGCNVKVEFLKNGAVDSTSGAEYPICSYKAVTIIQRAVAESLLGLGDARAAELEANAS